MTLIEQVKKAKESPYKSYIYGDEKQIVFTDDYVFILRQQTKTDRDLYLVYHLKTDEWETHQSGVLTLAQIEALCSVLDIKMPFIKAVDSRFIGSIANSVEKFPDNIRVPSSRTVDYSNSLRLTISPTPEKPNGVEILTTFQTRIVDNVVMEWNSGAFHGNWISNSLGNKLELKNGDKVKVSTVRTKDAFVLTKEKFVGKHEDSYRKGAEDLMIKYPVDIDGNVMEYQEFWYKPFDNYTNIQKWLCELDIDIPPDFWFDKCVNHFYGKKIIPEKIKEYVKIHDECECIRCIGFDVLKSHNISTHIKGFNFTYYQILHAGIFGRLPSGDEMVEDCSCKGCVGLRKRDDVYLNNLPKIFTSDMHSKGYPEEQIDYVLIGGKALPKIKPSKCIPNYDKKDEIDFEQFTITKRLFVGIAKGSWSASRILKMDYSLRDKYAILHCRLSGVKLSEVKQEGKRWQMEVFNSQLNPECECNICREIKHTNSGFDRALFTELMLEPIDARVYPTSIFEYHFGGGYRFTSPQSKTEYLDYFNSFILWEKFCECERCIKFKDRAESEKFLPPEELRAPKCPGCGGSVHQKDLIYLNADIAKKILEQNIDKTIKIKTAFCCSCYGKYSRIFKLKTKLQGLEEGSIIKYKGKKKTIFYDEEGIKFVGKIRMSEFLNYEDSHEAILIFEKSA